MLGFHPIAGRPIAAGKRTESAPPTEDELRRLHSGGSGNIFGGTRVSERDIEEAERAIEEAARELLAPEPKQEPAKEPAEIAAPVTAEAPVEVPIPVEPVLDTQEAVAAIARARRQINEVVAVAQAHAEATRAIERARKQKQLNNILLAVALADDD